MHNNGCTCLPRGIYLLSAWRQKHCNYYNTYQVKNNSLADCIMGAEAKCLVHKDFMSYDGDASVLQMYFVYRSGLY